MKTPGSWQQQLSMRLRKAAPQKASRTYVNKADSRPGHAIAVVIAIATSLCLMQLFRWQKANKKMRATEETAASSRSQGLNFT